MSRAELLALAERVEALNGADDVVNEAIALLIRGQCDWPLVLAPRFTASLDAAMGLVPEGGHWVVGSGCIASVWVPLVDGDRKRLDSFKTASPALALTAAALRARAEGVA